MMRTLRKVVGHSMLIILMLTGTSFLGAQDSAKQDMKDAGQETKEAAKDTG
jgi:hypothetical protein